MSSCAQSEAWDYIILMLNQGEVLFRLACWFLVFHCLAVSIMSMTSASLKRVGVFVFCCGNSGIYIKSMFNEIGWLCEKMNTANTAMYKMKLGVSSSYDSDVKCTPLSSLQCLLGVL